MNIINIEHISKIFGGKVIFDDISCGISDGEKIGVIGINGTGKTTFLRVLAGLEEADQGRVITQNGTPHRLSAAAPGSSRRAQQVIRSYVTQDGQREHGAGRSGRAEATYACSTSLGIDGP